MDGFNFAFSLFAIILGLSLVEVLTGFARALRRRQVVHLGWLTPLLAIFVMLDLTSFWEWVWSGRRLIDPGYGILLIGVVVSGLYYLAASLVFPSEFGEGRQLLLGADFDAHYMEHRRQVLGAILACNVITTTPVIIIRAAEVAPRAWIEWIIYYGALVALIAMRGKKASIAVLLVLIAGYAFTAVASFVQPVPF
ncbi:MAG TPA: hypothetical protein VFK19_06985 [Sphingomicrobium sp.]|nr:hypothetical protein [Sphingomicrobium sp.]